MTDVQLTNHACIYPALLFSILSQKSVKITRIRLLDREPGLNENEAAYAKLLAELTNGSSFNVNETGTSVTLHPGTIRGGRVAMQVAPTVHLVSLLQHVAPLAAFAKTPFDITLEGGITDGTHLNPDYFRCVTLPLLEKFGLVGAQFEAPRRGCAPDGGGVVHFTCPAVRRQLVVPRGLDIADGRVAKVRGVAYALRISPQLGNRVSQAARDALRDVAPDVFFNTDCRSNRNGAGGNSPGFGMALWAEMVSEHDAANNPSSKVQVHSLLGVSGGGSKLESPEQTGQRVAAALLQQVAARGMVDQTSQALVVSMMAACPQDVVRASVGSKLAEDAVHTLRLAKAFLGVMFKMAQPHADAGITLSCVGAGTVNLARKVT
jgi:RNA 3'-terminal phosphate cyclase-like protein